MSEIQQALFADEFMDKHAAPVLKDIETALTELVANAWDAGATRVDIDWPDSDAARPFRIVDNGHGMTDQQFSQRWLKMYYDRSEEQGDTVEFPPGVTIQRTAYGRNGLGRHAGFFFGPEYVVETFRDGEGIIARVSRGHQSPLKAEIERVVNPIFNHGTILIVPQTRRLRTDSDRARQILGLRFLTDPSFRVFVDGKPVTFEDIPDTNIERSTIEVEGYGLIRLVILNTNKTDRTMRQHGVAWRVSNRLVGECTWKGTGHESFLDGRRLEAKRYTFMLFADFLQDDVLPNWSGFDPHSERWQKAQEAAYKHIGDWLVGFGRDRRETTKRVVYHASKDKLKKLSRSQLQLWQDFIERVLIDCPSVTERDIVSIGNLLATLEESNHQYSLVDQLASLDTLELDELHRLMSDWSIRAAKIVLDELQGRIRLVDELKRKVVSESTDEVQELQPLFHQGLWIFGPNFETIEFTSNEGMTSVVRKLFKSDTKGSRNRPDFVVLPDGSAGFYTYPLYDNEMSEIGTAQLVVVELKKPGVSIGDEQKDQAWRYIKELQKLGHIVDRTRVTAFVLGSKIQPRESGARTEWNGQVTIQPMLYSTIIARAKSRLLKLYDRVQDAPFLIDAEQQGLIIPRGEIEAQLSNEQMELL